MRFDTHRDSSWHRGHRGEAVSPCRRSATSAAGLLDPSAHIICGSRDPCGNPVSLRLCRHDWPGRVPVGGGGPRRQPEPHSAHPPRVSRPHARSSTITAGAAPPRHHMFGVPQPGQTKRRPLARDVWRRARRRSERRRGAARQQRRQPARPSNHGPDRTADAEGRGASRRGVDRAPSSLDRSGCSRHADVGAGPCSVGGAAGARSTGDSADPLALVVVDDRSLRRGVSRRAAERWNRRRSPMQCSSGASTSTSGASSRARKT